MQGKSVIPARNARNRVGTQFIASAIDRSGAESKVTPRRLGSGSINRGRNKLGPYPVTRIIGKKGIAARFTNGGQDFFIDPILKGFCFRLTTCEEKMIQAWFVDAERKMFVIRTTITTHDSGFVFLFHTANRLTDISQLKKGADITGDEVDLSITSEGN